MGTQPTSPELPTPQEKETTSPTLHGRIIEATLRSYRAVKEVTPEATKRYLAAHARLYKENNPIVREGTHGFLRTLANLGISGLDVIPGAGEAPSWSADALKFVNMATRRFGVKVDLTPDVSKRLAVSTELLEIPTGTWGPSHVAETYFQFKADWPRIKAAFQETRRIMRAEAQDYQAHQPQIDAAMDAFGVKPPQMKGDNNG